MSLLLRFGKHSHWYIAPRPDATIYPRKPFGEDSLNYRDHYEDIDRFAWVYPLMHKAVNAGLLADQAMNPCQLCGGWLNVVGHHESYFLWFAIVMLCRECHGERHKAIRFDKYHCGQTPPVISVILMEAEPNILKWDDVLTFKPELRRKTIKFRKW